MRESEDLSMDRLRALPHGPRLHPNGFITLDIDETRKLHVWPKVPLRTRPAGLVHDHVFAFRSRVLKGALTDERYGIFDDPIGTYCVYVADCVSGRCHTQERPSSGLMRQSETRYRVSLTSQRIIRSGQSYDFPVETFHASHPMGFTATLMEISDFGTAPSARILFPCTAKPEYFPRTPQDAHEVRLVWDYIASAIA